MFKGPHCVQRAHFHLPSDTSSPCDEYQTTASPSSSLDRAVKVYSDPQGGLWMVTESHSIRHIASSQVSQFLQQHALNESVQTTPSSSMCTVHQCSDRDQVLTILFTANANSFDAPLATVVTRCGHILVFSCASPNAPLQQSHLGLTVTSAAVMDGIPGEEGILVSCFEEPFSEVVRVLLERRDSNTLSSNIAVSLSATSLYRIEGAIGDLLYEPLHKLVISASDKGNVDVWSWAEERDVTRRYGALSWDTATHGTPTCCVMLRDRIWIGTSLGCILVGHFEEIMQDESSAVAVAASTPASLVVLEGGHTPPAPITHLLAMSLGTRLWSCAEGSSEVKVWNTQSASLDGSFVFPDNGLLHFVRASRSLETVLWGIDRGSGAVAQFACHESLVSDTAVQFLTPEEVLIQLSERQDMLAMESVLLLVCEQLRGYKLDVLPPSTSEAVQRLCRSVDGLQEVEYVPDAIHALTCAQEMVRGAAYTRGGNMAENLSGFLDDLSCLVHEHKQFQKHHEEIHHFLCSVKSTLLLSEIPDTLVDVLQIMEALQSKAANSGVPQIDAGAKGEVGWDTSVDEEEDTTATSAEVRRLLQELSMEQDRLLDCERQLQHAREEQHALSVKLERSHQLLQEREEQMEMLEKSLAVSRKAAQVTSSGVAQLFDMESKLHEANEAIAALEDKLQQSDSIAADLREAVEAQQLVIEDFEAKEAIAWSALTDALDLQNDMVDEVSSLVDDVLGYCDDESNRRTDVLSIITDRLFDAEDFVHAGLEQQKQFFSELKQKLQTSLSLSMEDEMN